MGLTVGGQPVTRARLVAQRHGAWVLDFSVSDPSTLEALANSQTRVTVESEGGISLTGSTERGGVWLESGFVRLAPGANGLKKLAKPKFYRNTSIGVAAKDLLATAGETLSPTSDPKLLSVQLPFWTQRQTRIGHALTALIEDRRLTAPVWRSLTDGTVWLGFESWPDAGLTAPANYQDIEEAPQEGVALTGFEAWVIMPGVSLEGRHVSAVEHSVDGEAVRSKIWFEV